MANEKVYLTMIKWNTRKRLISPKKLVLIPTMKFAIISFILSILLNIVSSKHSELFLMAEIILPFSPNI